ncbi:MAG TPA: hypothetical protein DG753_00500 [Clostridium sp.]|nr:hypothetical protein [Clostridium sp.]
MYKNRYKFKVGSMILSAAFIVLTTASLGGCSYKAKIEKETTNSESEENVKEHKELEDFNKINADVDTGEVKIVKGDKYVIETDYDSKRYKVTYEVKGGELVVHGENKDKELTFFNWGNNKSIKIRIYVPEDKINEINMDMGSGNSKIKSISADKLKIDCGSGNVEIENADYNKMNIEMGSGNFDGDKIKCDEMNVQSSSGIICCDSLETNMLNIKTSSGNIDLEGELKGKNTIEASSGCIDIKTSLSKKDYSYDISCNSGEIEVDGEEMKNKYKNNNISAPNSFNIECSSGDINIRF